MRKMNVLVMANRTNATSDFILSARKNPRLKIELVTSVEDTISKFQQGDFDIVAIDDSIEMPTLQMLRRLFVFQQQDVTIVAANFDNLLQEIDNAEALLNKDSGGFKVIDNALANARFNVTIN